MAYVIYVDDENEPVSVQHAFFGETAAEARQALDEHRKQDAQLDAALKGGAEELVAEIDDSDRPGSPDYDEEAEDEEEDEDEDEEEQEVEP